MWRLMILIQLYVWHWELLSTQNNVVHACRPSDCILTTDSRHVPKMKLNPRSKDYRLRLFDIFLQCFQKRLSDQNKYRLGCCVCSVKYYYMNTLPPAPFQCVHWGYNGLFSFAVKYNQYRLIKHQSTLDILVLVIVRPSLIAVEHPCTYSSLQLLEF